VRDCKDINDSYLFVNALDGIAKYLKEITNNNGKEEQIHQVCHIYKRYLFKAVGIKDSNSLSIDQFPNTYIVEYNTACGNKSGCIFI
jgi:hypothetical protein